MQVSHHAAEAWHAALCELAGVPAFRFPGVRVGSTKPGTARCHCPAGLGHVLGHCPGHSLGHGVHTLGHVGQVCHVAGHGGGTPDHAYGHLRAVMNATAGHPLRSAPTMPKPAPNTMLDANVASTARTSI